MGLKNLYCAQDGNENDGGWQRNMQYMAQEAMCGNFVVFFECEKKTWYADCRGANETELDGNERIRFSNNDKNDAEKDGIYCLCQIESADAFNIGNDSSSFFCDVRHGRKVGI